MNDINIDCGVCRLRSFRLDDVESLVRYANNPKIVRWLRDRFPHPYTMEHAVCFLSETLSRTEDSTHFTLAIEIDGEAVGGIGIIRGTDIERVSAELGYWLAEPFWGRGIITTTIRHFAPWVMARFELTRLFADIFTENPASARVLEKAGFVLEGVKRRAAIKRGEIHDMRCYALVR